MRDSADQYLLTASLRTSSGFAFPAEVVWYVSDRFSHTKTDKGTHASIVDWLVSVFFYCLVGRSVGRSVGWLIVRSGSWSVG